ncbi:hypothetical protein [uncultured Tateyamaria sp.]|uniref:pPIWI-associating nuclease domain-containing protein n=1 Tax=uncultured Tateyamaria sp. TaxID=455651 RepID=UPI00261BA798|nr:hypothetical protein [uncultured Tateyamaria sp.]
MPRRMSPSEVRSKLRQAQSKYNRAVNRYNSAVRAHNQQVRTAVSKYNREVNSYNSAARAHNARVRANRERLRRELAKLERAASRPAYVTLRTSVNSVQHSYSQLEARAETGIYSERYNNILDLSEREAANSAEVMNALLGNPEDAGAIEDLTASELDPILSELSGDALDRWHGALFSLNPRNPDAARHFCTSARELLAMILDKFAPNRRVLEAMPDCETIPSGAPSRRAKIRYFLHQRELADEALEAFVDEDLENVLQLFRTFNDGTHGSSGRFTHAQLVAIKKRVEGAVSFLWHIIPQPLRQAA